MKTRLHAPTLLGRGLRPRGRRVRFRLGLGIALLALVPACAYGPPLQRAKPLGAQAPLDPVSRAVRYLEGSQLGPDGSTSPEEVGDWPQWLELQTPPFRIAVVREVSPFVPATVHLALSALTPAAVAALGFSEEETRRVQRVRRRAAAFIRRFEIRREDVPRGAFGFWPLRVQRPDAGFDGFIKLMQLTTLLGPRPFGPLAPRYGPATPRAFGLWPDLDTTAFAQLALEHDAAFDGGPPLPVEAQMPFLAARDLDASRRRRPSRHTAATGAYLVWLQPPDAPWRNELDMVVGAHAILSLARQGRSNLPGFSETVRWIDASVRAGLHRSRDYATNYYPAGFTLHAEVARAFRDGPIPGLAEAARLLADEVERAARREPDGTVSWPGPDDPYPTVLALSALLATGRSGPLVAGGLRHLLAAQDPTTGGWPAATVWIGESEGGPRFRWRTAAVPSALALEVLVRYRLQNGTHPEDLSDADAP